MRRDDVDRTNVLKLLVGVVLLLRRTLPLYCCGSPTSVRERSHGRSWMFSWGKITRGVAGLPSRRSHLFDIEMSLFRSCFTYDTITVCCLCFFFFFSSSLTSLGWCLHRGQVPRNARHWLGGAQVHARRTRVDRGRVRSRFPTRRSTQAGITALCQVRGLGTAGACQGRGGCDFLLLLCDEALPDRLLLLRWDCRWLASLPGCCVHVPCAVLVHASN